ncbi:MULTISPECIES: TIGR01212 family radical SAM protein [Shewanella]|uniref:TIGR01212 family radical SAM protein n=1 Tax=Shewanella psychromarinicola TaxID=2487742 RepID=A0A3N4E7K3_9GAMM|nr:TIGR01212 family radical SAM protein [Shewanella psychromarinicola]AZG35251.1 TIGR01212 family radical SAM protein [Shewanella psychromarinicola]MCL1081651.1 TIGR01212 family radical SAM protein [Shewanella psychromarinicola]RPA32946.1 TIGR01212 family radical SAM protein [Shewanella psychromarinicola]
MGLDDYVNTFGLHCKQRYGQRIKKLTIDAQFTCPNRDGTLGVGGCTFCNVASFSGEQDSAQPIAVQLSEGKIRAQSAKKSVLPTEVAPASTAKYIAYFQAYTSTYDEYKVLKQKYDQAVEDTDIVGLHIGTRPDCVPNEVLDLLVEYQQRGIEVWLELGLQTANNQTLKRINRGHQLCQYRQTVKKARARGIKVCTHLILGLPGETSVDYFNSLQTVLGIGVDGLKLHPLHIVEGSIMAKQWRYNPMPLIGLDEYASEVAKLIRHTPKDIIFHRVTAYAKKPMLLAPDWCAFRWDGLVAIVNELRDFGGQGSALMCSQSKTV